MKVKRLETGDIQYNCTCGKSIILSCKKDDPPKRLIKCFDCIDSENWELKDIQNIMKNPDC